MIDRPPRHKGGRPRAPDPLLSVSFRMPQWMLDQIDLERGKRARGEVVREAVEMWLEALEPKELVDVRDPAQ